MNSRMCKFQDWAVGPHFSTQRSCYRTSPEDLAGCAKSCFVTKTQLLFFQMRFTLKFSGYQKGNACVDKRKAVFL